MTGPAQTEISWRRFDADWDDRARLQRVPAGWSFSGDIRSAGGTDRFPPAFLATNDVAIDDRWRSKTLRVSISVGTHAGIPDLLLRRLPDGGWESRDGGRISALDGATDVDLFLTPATNTLPLRRLALPVGGSGTIVAALMSLGDPADGWLLERNTQHYERLDTDRYRFLSLDTMGTVDFEAELVVTDGIVHRYGDHWERG